MNLGLLVENLDLKETASINDPYDSNLFAEQDARNFGFMVYSFFSSKEYKPYNANYDYVRLAKEDKDIEDHILSIIAICFEDEDLMVNKFSKISSILSTHLLLQKQKSLPFRYFPNKSS